MATVPRVQKRRHVAVLGSQSSDYQRRKISVACQVCRARRTKCDAARPCGFCVKTGSQCTEEPVDDTLSNPEVKEILRQLQGLQSHVVGIADAVELLAAHAVQESPRTPASTLSQADHVSIYPGNLEETLSLPAFAAFDVPILKSELDLLATSASNLDRAVPLELVGDLGSADVLAYVDSYFTRVHIKNPVLLEDEFRRCYRAVCANGIGWDAESCLILLVLANGAASPDDFAVSTPEDGQHLYAARAFFSAAHKRVGTLMTGSPLLQARCLFLCGVYFMSTLQPYSAWRAFLQALAACKALTPVSVRDGMPTDTNTETAAEESIYWSCWKSEQELRYELGIPCNSPTNEHEVEHPLLYPRLPQKYSEHEVQSWYFYLGEISLWRQEMSTRAKMRESLDGPRRDTRHLARICLQASEALDSWQESLPPSLRLGEGIDHDVLKFVLRGRRSYIYELITWPFLYAKFQSLPVPEEACELVELGLKTHCERLVYNSPGFKYRHHGTWLMQRSSARSACLLLLAAHNAELAPALPVGWRAAVEATVEMLTYWRPGFESGGTLTNFMCSMLATAPSPLDH